MRRRVVVGVGGRWWVHYISMMKFCEEEGVGVGWVGRKSWGEVSYVCPM